MPTSCSKSDGASRETLLHPFIWEPGFLWPSKSLCNSQGLRVLHSVLCSSQQIREDQWRARSSPGKSFRGQDWKWHTLFFPILHYSELSHMAPPNYERGWKNRGYLHVRKEKEMGFSKHMAFLDSIFQPHLPTCVLSYLCCCLTNKTGTVGQTQLRACLPK